jgi:sterol desaturase/sphingolipid hydroxylase (fatty acid hydroxylase superfamily)
MPWPLLSPLIIVGSALILILLERRFPYAPHQRLLRQGFWTDLVGYGIVQSYLLGLVITAVIVWIDAKSGLSRLRIVTDWPFAVQLAFFLVTHDFYIYWFHRWQHYSNVLWRIHEAHHSVDDVDWLSGTRSHSFEILINQTIEFLPIALLGAPPEVALAKATVDAVWGMYIHSNIDVRSGPLQRVINGPEMHRWHHARDLPAPGKNFATKLAIWDFLFGTAHLPAHKPPRYGLGDARYPKAGALAYLRQHVYSFRRPDD